MKIENKKVVAVVLEVEINVPEFYKSTRIGETALYFTEIEGQAIVGTLMPSNKHRGYYELLNDLFALELNEETRNLVSDPKLSAVELLALMERYQEQLG
ncbi:hypothetical protein AB685_14940 [Bacillus sp. LL01]|uniref:hypothetical protein n=1 Tax=Bacillus sp. LL01 TaxID=1665556 RepID=UPI00064D3D84|nr:hypothetical protein [Bacillus sp. LL01]KMJ58099.1 hypothetical protein AB685_14940 [Bacillus sp. LL01]